MIEVQIISTKQLPGDLMRLESNESLPIGYTQTKHDDPLFNATESMAIVLSLLVYHHEVCQKLTRKAEMFDFISFGLITDPHSSPLHGSPHGSPEMILIFRL